ncbi:MAG: response regulator transcription factor [Clostridia bacterium]|nr:response regulator transcription factor [Clostridia bacterium]
MARIIIVEDDENIANTIKATISMVGYSGDICEDGLLAVDAVKSGRYDLVLLDVMLPGLDGFEVMERIKATGVPVIFLTARQNVLDKVNGLRLGAEDYIVKPFEPLELLARIEVVLRRQNKLSDTMVYGDLCADVSKHTVTKCGKRISLTPKEFDLFVYFLKNIDIAIPRERLLSAVWGFEFEGESRTVDIHIQQIRKKLSLQKALVTIPKLGYRLDSFEEGRDEA